MHQPRALHRHPVLQQLLNQVVAERIHRERHNRLQHSLKHQIDMQLGAQIKLVLEKTATVLIVRELKDA